MAKIIFMAGFCVLAAFAAAAPAEDESSGAAQFVAEVNEACRTGSVDLLGRRPGTAAQSARFRAFIGSETQDYLTLHQACVASVSGLTAGCGVLDGKNGKGRDCLDDVKYAAFVSAVFGKGDARAACGRFAASVLGTAPPKNGNRKVCESAIAALKRGSKDFCGDGSAAGWLKGPALYECRQFLVYLDGVPDHCRSDSAKLDQLVCREKAALLSALRSSDFHDCANSPWCRALSSRKAEACDPYLDRADKLFCDDQLALARKGSQKPVYQKGAPMATGSPELSRQMEKFREQDAAARH